MNTSLLFLLASVATVAAGAALFLAAANSQLRRLLAVREAELRHLKLAAGHAADEARFQEKPDDAKDVLDAALADVPGPASGLPWRRPGD